MKRTTLILMALALTVLSPQSAVASIIYQNDFETNTNGFSGFTTTVTLPITAMPTPTSTFLGQFGNISGVPTSPSVLTLTGLAPGTPYTLAFDLFAGLRLDGTGIVEGNGPDPFTVLVGSTSTFLLNANFANFHIQQQSYSDATPLGGGPFPKQTGADVTGVNDNGGNISSIYYFSHGAGNPLLTFTPTGSTETIMFTGSPNEDTVDEFYAIDNVVVTGAAVPEPSSFALVIIGIFAAARFFGWRRRKTAAA